MKVTAVIPAAGSGSRSGSDVPKQFVVLGDRPLVVHTLQVFESAEEVNEIILVVPAGMEDRCRSEWIKPFGFKKVGRLVPGGRERQDSVFSGLKQVDSETDFVIIHDGARPFVSHRMILDVIESATRYGGAVIAVPVKETIKSVGPEGIIAETIDRCAMFLAQTPQAFPKNILLAAYERAYNEGVVETDDSALVERMGHRVRVISGSWANIKVTLPEDFALAEQILKWKSDENACDPV